MGCDIHMYVEYKCGNGMPWQADSNHKPTWDSRCKDDYPDNKGEWCEYCLEDGDTQVRCDQGYLDYNQVSATGRDYSLFAKMASVRGSGPIEPRGLPDNVSETISYAAEKYGSDGHSHSYLSLEEFRDILVKAKYPPTDRCDAFYKKDYSEEGWKKRPPDYSTIVNYCEKLKEEKSIDKHILGPDTSSEVQIRLVFWFDN